jgi:type I restriction enzyme S subunit
MSEWKECKLGDLIQDKIAELQTGPFGTMLNASEYTATGTPVIAVQDIGNNKLHSKKLNFINQETALRLAKYQVKVNDIIFGRKGAVDRRAIVTESENGWMQGSDCIRLRFNEKIDALFISYQLGSNQLKEWLIQHSHGATMPSLNQEILSLLPLSLPPLSEQKAIAGVLSSLDDKIDLLHRQNKTLEAMAETLFRQWFVEDADKGWEEGSLGQVLSLIESGKRPKGGIDPDLKDGIPSIGAENINGIGQYDYSKSKFITKEFFSTMKRGIIQDYDVLIYKDGAYVGRKGMFGHNFPYEICSINEHVFILRANDRINQFFLYFILQEDDLSQLNANSAQPGLNQESIKSFEIVIPSKELINEFGFIVKPWINKIFFNAKQINILEKLRDTLLPKLMNGDVRVAV